MSELIQLRLLSEAQAPGWSPGGENPGGKKRVVLMETGRQ